MSVIRALARPMLASMFVTGGLDTLRHPAPKVPAADPVVSGLAQWLPSGVSTKQVVLADGALKVAAGGLLAFGRFPRLSALALAGSLVPTTIAGHAFWKESDPAKRRQQRVHFIKNVSMLGGLLIAAVDTEGKPSLAWRARRAPEAVKHAAADLRRDVLGTTASAVRERLAG
jgi:putative oxidoreductase